MSPSTAQPARLQGAAARTRNATLIYNPYAGHDDWQQQIEGVARFWCDHGWAVTLQTTQGPGHATELAAAAAAAGVEVVISAGGDGTLHEVAQGLIHTPCILAPLPAGTTNCLTRDLGDAQVRRRRSRLADRIVTSPVSRTRPVHGCGVVQQRETVAALGGCRH